MHNSQLFPALGLWAIVVGAAIALPPRRDRPPATGFVVALAAVHTAVALAAMSNRFKL